MKWMNNGLNKMNPLPFHSLTVALTHYSLTVNSHGKSTNTLEPAKHSKPSNYV